MKDLETYIIEKEAEESTERGKLKFYIYKENSKKPVKWLNDKEEYQKIVSTEDKLLEINETEVAIFNENKAFGSNLFTGIVNSPYFPIGVEETTIMKGLLPIVEDYFKRTYGDGTRRENKD